MKRQNRTKKIKLPGFLDGIKDFVIAKTATFVVIIIFIIVALLFVKAFLYRSDYFRVRTIETRGIFVDQRIASNINRQLLNFCKGRNIFKINLKLISDSLRSSYPDAREATVRIALPDRLVISMKFRRPFAIVHYVRLYPVDEDGVAILGAAAGDLPIIEGARLSSDNLKISLDLLKEIRRARFMANYTIERINAEDSKNLLVYLKNGVEIRIGGENFKERLEILAKILKDPRLIIDMVKYIDVRFKDAVIGPK